MRPTMQETIMTSAWILSHRSTCSRLHVGTIIADSRGVSLSSGYNGALAGFPHCRHSDDDGPCKTSLHAELNAILWAARRGVSVENGHLYTTHEPCYECAKVIIQSGIGIVYYSRDYSRNSGLDLLKKANVIVHQLLVTVV